MTYTYLENLEEEIVLALANRRKVTSDEARRFLIEDRREILDKTIEIRCRHCVVNSLYCYTANALKMIEKFDEQPVRKLTCDRFGTDWSMMSGWLGSPWDKNLNAGKIHEAFEKTHPFYRIKSIGQLNDGAYILFGYAKKPAKAIK